jgi:hypothetical protein
MLLNTYKNKETGKGFHQFETQENSLSRIFRESGTQTQEYGIN